MSLSWEFVLGVGGLAFGVVGIALSILAIAQATYFYTQAKRTETSVQKALEGIQGQTQTLSQISSQQLKGLTQIVREQIRQPDRGFAALSATLDQLLSANRSGFVQPDVVSSPTGPMLENHGIPALGPVDTAVLREQAATGLFAIYFYAAQTNVMAQQRLPSADDYDESNEAHRYARALLDVSAGDFFTVASTLDQWAETEAEFVGGHRLYNVFGKEGQKLRSQILSARAVFEAKQTPPAT